MFRLMIAALACALVLKAAAVPAVAMGEVEKGRELAEALCAGCHLNEGQGEKQWRIRCRNQRLHVADRTGGNLERLLAGITLTNP